VETTLGLMAGAGALPGRVAAEARRQGFRVVAFAFDRAEGLEGAAHEIIPSSVTAIQTVLQALGGQGVRVVVFAGKFWKQTALAEAERTDAAGRELVQRGLSDQALAQGVVTVLGGLGVEVLDPRRFLGPWLLHDRLGALEPTPGQWDEIRAGFALGRQLAGFGVGQTVVRARGVTVAVEAAEGTDETIRRGCALAGPGAVVIKTVAPDHDYRFDVPTVGLATIEAMAAGGAVALAVPAGRVLGIDAATFLPRAAAAGIALVAVEDSAA
jgi:hypothetical protein